MTVHVLEHPPCKTRRQMSVPGVGLFRRPVEVSAPQAAAAASPGTRIDRVAAIRRAIRAGLYDLDERLDITLDRMIDVIERGG